MYYSYVMGVGKDIFVLKKQGFKIKKRGSDFEVVFKPENVKTWEEFIVNNLQVGFWNEYLAGDKVVFLFNLQDGIHRYEVQDFENEEVLALCEKLCERDFGSIKNMLFTNKFYRKILNKIESISSIKNMNKIKLLQLKQWDNYLAFVKNKQNYDGIAEISIGSEDELISADAEKIFNELPQYKLLLEKYVVTDLDKVETAFEKVVTLMNYLTAHTYYSGVQTHIVADDGVDILKWAFDKDFKHAINCRFKAIAFTDLLLANGIKAYPVLMLDETKNGCHFMTQAYLSELHKWAIFDPSFNSYFILDNKLPLDVYELRAAMLNDINSVEIVGYNFNNTQECKDIYKKHFVCKLLTNLSTWQDNSNDKRHARNLNNRKQFNAKLFTQIL